MAIFIAPPSARPVAVKAGPIGSGAGVLLTEYPLVSFLGKDPHQKMRTAYQMGMSVPWIRTAERLIGAKVAGVDVDLNDPEGVEITASYPSPDAVAAWTLLDKPQALLGVGQPLSRSSLFRLYSRHLGLAGNSFFLQDQPEAFAGTPKALAYLRPDRLTPKEDANGNLTGWYIDKTPRSEGIEVSLEQIVHFMLEPPDSGHFGPGLVESALLMAQLSTSLDRHLASVLQAGGRISGFVSPKEGSLSDEQMLALGRDWRTITEQPDAAKRLQLIAAPVEFTHTTMTPEELAIVDLMKLMRDDLFIAWNVPGSLVGVTSAAGLNSGDTRKYDEAALWQGPVHDRLVTLQEGLQDSVLSKWQKRMGWTPELVLEEPEFDDDSPRYDLLGKSINIAMRNRERRELIGLDPFGDPMLDDAVWLPISMVSAFSAPDEGTPAEIAAEPTATGNPTEPASDQALNAAGETSTGKANLVPRLGALRNSLIALRNSMATHHTPRIKQSVSEVLQEQRTEIAQRIRAHAEQITRKPKDRSVWWDGKRWDRELRTALIGGVAGMATAVNREVDNALPAQKASPIGAVDRVLDRGAARVTGINTTTADEIAAILASALEADVSLLDIADAIENGTDLTPLIGRAGGLIGDLDYRAEMIARTELMDAYNASALFSYSDAGVTQVQAIDGDGDEECAERDGQVFDIDEADSIEDHPNGTLDWVPVLGDVPMKALVPPVPLSLGEQLLGAIVALSQRESVTNIYQAEQKAAQVTLPEINVQPPDVTVNVAAAPVPNVTVNLPDKPKKIVRDANGGIVGIE